MTLEDSLAGLRLGVEAKETVATLWMRVSETPAVAEVSNIREFSESGKRECLWQAAFVRDGRHSSAPAENKDNNIMLNE